MKRLVLFALVLSFATTLATGPAWSAEKKATASATATASAGPAQRVEYNLPYPGLLPDSPFYIFKVARDRVVELFLRNPKDLAFYNLLLSDKRVAAGEVLTKGGKSDLGATTILQGQDYYRRAVDLALKVKDENLLAKLVVAGAKHEDVITDLQPKVSGDGLTKLGNALLSDQKDKNRVLELLMSK